MRSRFAPFLLLSLAACTHRSNIAPVASPSGDASVDVAAARAKHLAPQVEWLPYEPASFAKAKKEGRFVLIDGAAEWCHWCHVMDETTYRDPEIGKILAEKYVAIRVDIDARPDIAERYGAWGWPATIVMNADAEEVGKFRGYIPAERLKSALLDALAAKAPSESNDRFANAPAKVDDLPWVAARTIHDLDAWWDPKEGGWGKRQKAPIGADVEVELLRAAHGDSSAKERAVLTLTKEEALLDPVWGGLYQYSAAGNWNEPHYEKLMTVQAAGIEAYARAYASTKEPRFLADARAIAGYLDRFLSDGDGRFFTNQDADVGAHDPNATFVEGKAFYAKDDAARRAIGAPWIDTHVYARENGLAIAALLTMSEATLDEAPKSRAKRAADAIAKSHVTEDGHVLHDAAKKDGPYFLSDAAELVRAYAKLGDVERATKIATTMEKEFFDASSGAPFDASIDADAAGVFARRTRSFEAGVAAARAYAALGKASKDEAWTRRAREILAAIATPAGLDAAGRWVGGYVLALEEAGAIGW